MYCMHIYRYLLVGNCSSSNHSSSPLFPWHQKFNIAIQEAMVGGASILIWGKILYCRTKMPRHISLIIVVRKTDCFLITASYKSFRYLINKEWFLAKTGSLSLLIYPLDISQIPNTNWLIQKIDHIWKAWTTILNK